eukprot:3123959-Prymnesium_polylepis.5
MEKTKSGIARPTTNVFHIPRRSHWCDIISSITRAGPAALNRVMIDQMLQYTRMVPVGSLLRISCQRELLADGSCGASGPRTRQPAHTLSFNQFVIRTAHSSAPLTLLCRGFGLPNFAEENSIND